MSHAIEIENYGGAEALVWRPRDVPSPGEDEVRLKQTAVGLNYIDVYHRTGLYPLPSLPAIIGLEAAGEVVDVGAGVSDLEVGDRVAYTDQLGAYAQERLIKADRVVKLPEHISDELAASMMLQGLTVHYLLRKTFPVNAETTLLFHAAAGGVGLIACQWARHLGATMIGTVGSDEKAELARANGCTHVINYRRENFVERVKEITNGRGCDVVYDSVGKDTFPTSLDCLRPRGMWVSFGNASGAVPPFDISLLSQKGSLFMTRPTLMTYVAARDELVAGAGELFEMVGTGQLSISVNQRYALSDVAEAHRDFEARKTTGSTILIP